MNDSSSLRMLLSHNFDLIDDLRIPQLSREDFTQVFIDGFNSHPEIRCRQIFTSAHWIVEVLCPDDFLTPQQVGEKCAQILAASRLKSLRIVDFDILILGGTKTTAPISDSPDALLPGQWGVDVVETKSGAAFLKSIDWDGTVAGKSGIGIFKAEAIGSGG
jgi:Protein of unknown function (DUF2656)